MKLTFVSKVGYLSDSLLELRKVGPNRYMLRDGPLVVKGRIDIYESIYEQYLCYNVETLKKENIEVSETNIVTLQENKDGTYSEEGIEKIKTYIPKRKKKYW